jgi:hypothetical protein
MPILATKLYVPQLRPNVVSRPRLIERLNEGLHRKLTLISAPTGFGKTTLVSEWVEGIERQAVGLLVARWRGQRPRTVCVLQKWAIHPLAQDQGMNGQGL